MRRSTKEPKYPPKVLHLFLKHEWYDMIARGEKLEEYRDIGKWGRRVCTFGRTEECPGECQGCKFLISGYIYHTTIEQVCLHRGYTSTSLTFEVPTIVIQKGQQDWGAPKDKKVLGFYLYRRIGED